MQVPDAAGKLGGILGSMRKIRFEVMRVASRFWALILDLFEHTL